jgi:hypothetical protein
MNKLRIGDKIKWNVSVGGGIIYTVLDINTSRPPLTLGSVEFEEEILFQWEVDGIITESWGHSYEELNKCLNRGGITIVSGSMEPIKEIKEFTL